MEVEFRVELRKRKYDEELVEGDGDDGEFVVKK